VDTRPLGAPYREAHAANPQTTIKAKRPPQLAAFFFRPVPPHSEHDGGFIFGGEARPYRSRHYRRAGAITRGTFIFDPIVFRFLHGRILSVGGFFASNWIAILVEQRQRQRLITQQNAPATLRWPGRFCVRKRGRGAYRISGTHLSASQPKSVILLARPGANRQFRGIP
jgi:hypothetical protein